MSKRPHYDVEASGGIYSLPPHSRDEMLMVGNSNSNSGLPSSSSGKRHNITRRLSASSSKSIVAPNSSSSSAASASALGGGGSSSCGLPYRLLLPSHSIGFIVGKSGSTVKEIQSESGAAIQFQKEYEGPATLADKIVTVSGTRECKNKAVELILQKLRSLTRLQDMDGKEAIVVVVPHKAVAMIIGAQGQQIRELSQLSHCEIQVHKEQVYGPAERAISVRSSVLDNLVVGVSRINNLMEELVEKGKLHESDVFVSPGSSSQQLSSASYIPSATASSGGGPGVGPLSSGGGGGPGVGPLSSGGGGGPGVGPLSSGGGGPGGPFMSGLSANGSCGSVMQPPPPPPMSSMTMQGGPPGVPAVLGVSNSAGGVGGGGIPSSGTSAVVAVGGGSGGGNLLLHALGNRASPLALRFVITQDTAAWIVGKKGDHVKEIQRKSGAQLRIYDNLGPESSSVLSSSSSSSSSSSLSSSASPSAAPSLSSSTTGAVSSFSSAPTSLPSSSASSSSSSSPEEERILQISGSVRSKVNVLKLIMHGMEARKLNTERATATRLLVPTRSVSFLIGPKGNTINSLTHQSGAHLQVDKNDWPRSIGERLLVIHGSSEAKLVACLLLLQKLEEFEVPDIARENLILPIASLFPPSSGAAAAAGAGGGPPPLSLLPISGSAGAGAQQRSAVHDQSLNTLTGGPAILPLPGGGGEWMGNTALSSSTHERPPPPSILQPSRSVEERGVGGSGGEEVGGIITPAEMHFLNVAQQFTTPRVIATAQAYSLEVFFARYYVEALARPEENSARTALTDVMERSGCSVGVGVETSHNGHSRSLTLTGTPMATSIALLLILEKLMEMRLT